MKPLPHSQESGRRPWLSTLPAPVATYSLTRVLWLLLATSRAYQVLMLRVQKSNGLVPVAGQGGSRPGLHRRQSEQVATYSLITIRFGNQRIVGRGWSPNSEREPDKVTRPGSLSFAGRFLLAGMNLCRVLRDWSFLRSHPCQEPGRSLSCSFSPFVARIHGAKMIHGATECTTKVLANLPKVLARAQ